MTAWKARSPRTAPGDPVFVARAREGVHRRQHKGNVQARLETAVRAANVLLVEQGIEPIGKATPHSLRRLYASLRYACGDDPIYVAEQGGWSDPAFPMKVYAKAARRRSKLSGAHLAAFDQAIEWATVSSGFVREADRAGILDEPRHPKAVEETAA